MNRYRVQFRKVSAGCKIPVLVGACTLALSACGDRPDEPKPPHAPPRPSMIAAHVFTAQLDLPARPVLPPPGNM
jgi:hypothetical protein